MGRILRDQTIREEINTSRAHDFVSDTKHKPSDIQSNWWEMFYNYRTKRWKQEVKDLRDKTGISFEEVCEYIGIPRDRLPGFYRRLPKTRRTYIGIGMAYKVSLKTINRWLTKYGGKRKLYPKEALTDLIWIYLINSCHVDRYSDRNYFNCYEECRDNIHKIYTEINTQVFIEEETDTVEMTDNLSRVAFDTDYRQLKLFVRSNIGAFNSAYSKPRAFLKLFISNILRVKNEHKTKGRPWTLNSLRGYLDDSMINYITARNKEGPRSKKSHIAMGMALGMTKDDLDTYLQLMGYAPLDPTHLEEGVLINLLNRWDHQHPLQHRFKEKHINGKRIFPMKPSEELTAVNDMLRLRSDIKEMYEDFVTDAKLKHLPVKFPYMND